MEARRYTTGERGERKGGGGGGRGGGGGERRLFAPGARGTVAQVAMEMKENGRGHTVPTGIRVVTSGGGEIL